MVRNNKTNNRNFVTWFTEHVSKYFLLFTEWSREIPYLFNLLKEKNIYFVNCEK